MTVTIPVKTQYDGSGFAQAERDAKRAQQAAVQATRAQLAEHRKALQLTRQLDKELAGPGGKANFAQQIAQQTAASFGAIAVMQQMAGFTTDYTAKALEAAVANERLSTATNNMAASFGASGDAITEAVQRASEYTIKQTDAMQAANQAMLLGVAKSPAEFEKLTRVAVALGRAMGQDSKKSIEDMTIGLGRQSKLILDNLGLMVSAEKANEKYAAAIGKTVDELTDAEKKQAFINEALAQGEAKVAALGNSGLDTAGKIERLNSRLADFQSAFGGAILAVSDGSGVLNTIDPILSGATDALEEFADKSKAMNKLRDDAYKGREGLKALEDGADSAMAVINPLGLAIEKATNYIGQQIFNADALAKTQADLAATQTKAGDTAEDQADGEEKSAEAMKEAAKAAEELAKRLEAAQQARKGVAADLLDITDKATKDTAAAWDDYFKEEQGLWKDHSKAVEKINADSEKERVKIQKDLAKELSDIDKNLAKDLAKEDKNLARDLAKIKRDSEREISRRVQDQAREERKTRRQQQIDLKGDQRLFNFEMRQLAAEGEFNAILAAKERRAIEQQIAAEKSAEDTRQRDEDNRVEIQRMRQDAADQLAERQAQAEERKQELRDQAEERRQEAIEQAAEEEARRQEELAQALADEQASYEERLQALRENRDAKLAQIEETKNESLAKLAEELTQSKDLTREEMEATVKIAEELGPEVGAAYAEGINDGFERNLRINEMANAALGGGGTRPGRGGTVNPAHPTTATSIGQASPPRQNMNSIYGFASGGGFTVGGFGGTDSQLVQFLATPGERVSISPPGGQAININVNGPGGRELAAIMQRHVEAGLQEYHDSVIVPWSNGAS